MKSYQKKISAAIMSFMIMNTVVIPSYAATLTFTDVPKESWGYENIQWALENKVVKGYTDGTFQPNKAVSQSEFLAMLVRAYELDNKVVHVTSNKWDAPYINLTKSLNWKVEITDQMFTRGMAATYIANALGKNYSMDFSIQYVLDKDLANGKTKRTLDGFEKNDVLTRIEAVALIERLRNNNNTLNPIPVKEEKYNRQDYVFVYENKDLNFSLTLPKSWGNKFKTETVPRFGHSILFINTATKGGILFTISVCSSDYWEKKKEEIQGQIRAIKVGEYNNNSYIFHTPSDVQYDPSDKNATEDYLTMFKDVQKIMETFEIIN